MARSPSFKFMVAPNFISYTVSRGVSMISINDSIPRLIHDKDRSWKTVSQNTVLLRNSHKHSASVTKFNN